VKLRTACTWTGRTMRTLRTGIFPTFFKLNKNADNADTADRRFSNISKAGIIGQLFAPVRKQAAVRNPVRKQALYLSHIKPMRTMRTGVVTESITATTKGVVGGRTRSLYLYRKNPVRIGRTVCTQTEAAA